MFYVRDDGDFIYEITEHKAAILYYNYNVIEDDKVYHFTSREEKNTIASILEKRIMIQDEI